MTLQHEPEARWKQDVAVLGAFALFDEDAAVIQVDIIVCTSSRTRTAV
jgi:hypothetical protein